MSMTRRELRDAILNRRAVRMQQDQMADHLPSSIWLSPEDYESVIIDNDRDLEWYVQYRGPGSWWFMGVDMIKDPRVEPGNVRLDWPYELRGQR